MIELTSSAQTRLNDYLAELRRVLQECPAVDPVDVERDVHDHIEAALAGADTPVDEPHLDRVLRSLGVPRDWVQDAACPWYRYPQQVGRDLRHRGIALARQFVDGPESFRLPYLSFAVLVFGAFLLPFSEHEEQTVLILLVAGCTSFVLARAALSLHDAQPSIARLWLLAPALLTVYLPVAGILFGWPVLAGGLATAVLANDAQRAHAYYLDWERASENLRTLEAEMASQYTGTALSRALAEARREVEIAKSRVAATEHIMFAPPWLRQVHPVWLAVFATTAATGLWWLVSGVVAWRRPGWFRVLFRPFMDNYRGTSGLVLSTVGLLLLAAGLVLCLG